MLTLSSFIAGVVRKIDEEDASLSVPLRAGSLTPDQYKHHTGYLRGLAKAKEFMVAEYARLTQPQHKAAPKENDE